MEIIHTQNRYIRDITGNTISISEANISDFSGYCQKVPSDFKSKYSSQRNFIFNYNDVKYIAKQITLINKINTPCDMVWNIEVAEDNSYVANNYIVHNCVPGDVCSICLNYDNPFPSRAHYCDHLKYNMLQYDSKTGRLIYAINHNGYFFDLSIVRRPADRIAWGMVRVMVPGVDLKPNEKDNKIVLKTEKHASVGYDFMGYSSKLAEELGETNIIKAVEKTNVSGEKEAGELYIEEIFKPIKDNPDPYFFKYGSKMLLRTDIPIDKEALNYIARNYSLNDITSTFAGVGIIPTKSEFQRMVLVNSGLDKVADYLDENNYVFDTY